MIRHQLIGTYLDSDAISYDPKATESLHLVDIAPGVSQVSKRTIEILRFDNPHVDACC